MVIQGTPGPRGCRLISELFPLAKYYLSEYCIIHITAHESDCKLS